MRLPLKSMTKEIYNYAIYLISKQDYSHHKISKKLHLKYPDSNQEISDVIQDLESRGYIREDNYKRIFIKKWLSKGESEKKIRLRGALEELDFSADHFLQAQKELGLEPNEGLSKLIQKKLRSKSIPSDPLEKRKLKDKILRFLVSKGYSFDISISEINKHL